MYDLLPSIEEFFETTDEISAIAYSNCNSSKKLFGWISEILGLLNRS